ncbi:hypothetical protein H0H92_002364 [Tricholoma furcatifolium]|nr:hypothetical protein H0H92_002364 [Tricholoma furcatifolium]
MESFVDPKVEGPIGSTLDRRAEAYEYIQKQIHQSDQTISRYYKRRFNALSITCQIPAEILATIFSEVVDSTSENDGPYAEWISEVSHVCSHWREVALSTPRLWSTLHLDCPTQSLEMLRRSKDTPLSVVLYGQMFQDAYNVLHQVLASHLHRIKNLTLGSEMYIHIAKYQYRQIRPNEFRELLRLLGQNNGPLKLEQLILTTDPVEDFYHTGPPFLAIIQDDVITASPSLKHLELQGFGMNCGPLHTFHHLQSFRLLLIPEEFRPSLAQLLRFLSQMPVLEFLDVSELSTAEEVFPSHEGMTVHMRRLRDINIRCQSAQILNSFFDLVKFPKDAVSLDAYVSIDMEDADIEELLNESGFISFPRNISRKMDDATDGLVSKLSISIFRIECWKSKERPKDSSFPEEPPVIMIRWTVEGLSVYFLEGLRLDELVSLALDASSTDESSMDCLTLLGNLPRITYFKIFGNHPGYAIQSLCHGVTPVEQSYADSRPAFPALTTLFIEEWDFKDPLEASSSWRRGMMLIEALLFCVKLRARANVPIKLLQMKYCSGYGEKEISDPYACTYQPGGVDEP